MVILGIDPGLAVAGFGLIRQEKGHLTLLEYGVVRTKAQLSLASRLQLIYLRLQELIATYQPNHLAVEELFFNTNTSSALAVGQARGVILLAAAQAGMLVASYTPLQVKAAVCGYGRAEKQQVQYMVRQLLAMTCFPKPDDAADALAIAICHSHMHKIKSLT